MTRLRPVHRLSAPEAELQAAIVLPSRSPRANRLKATIEAYWAGRGRRAVVDIVNGELVSNIGPDGFPPPAEEAAP